MPKALVWPVRLPAPLADAGGAFEWHWVESCWQDYEKGAF
jgi:hypothetical protein